VVFKGDDIMRTRTTLAAPTMVAVGALLGWLAASGKVIVVDRAEAAPASAPVAGAGRQAGSHRLANQALQEQRGCCEKGSRNNLLVLAEQNDRGAAKLRQDSKKPNILVIFGDDIGQSNVSAYTHGLMGYHTPNIDRIAQEGMMFTDYYAEQSCTAGRSSFITGQCPLRTGLSKVGIPGATVGIQPRDATIAELLKNHGYSTGQFGKNHLGDRNEYLPTVHGFDEFFGNLYHLNAEEDPEPRTYPRDPKFKERTQPAAGELHYRPGGGEDEAEYQRQVMRFVQSGTCLPGPTPPLVEMTPCEWELF
jgi:hypothetical protein